MSGQSNNVRLRWWIDVLQHYVENDDHTVELAQAERYGVQIVVDGTPMFDVEGYPWETFTVGRVGEMWAFFSEDGQEKLREDMG